MLTLEPFGGLAAVTPASVLQLAVVMRAYEMVCAASGNLLHARADAPSSNA